MNAYAISLSKYVNTGIFVLFTLLSYIGFFVQKKNLSRAVEIIQRLLLAAFLINTNMTIAYFVRGATGRKLILLCAMEILFLLSFMVLYRIVHEMANMYLFNNICMLLSVGFVTISRIAFYGSAEITAGRGNEPLKQFVMASAGLMLMLIIPFFRKIFDAMRHFGIIFAILGIVPLAGVLLLSQATNGAMITYTIAGFTFQPSEFVKILFILMLAAMLSGEVTLNKAMLVSVLAAIHVGILVLSRDLGSALIYFIVYLMTLFLASGRWSVFFGGVFLGSAGAVVCALLFPHVMDRVTIWRDPFVLADGDGYQIVHSLFAISYGGLWGTGLTQGMPTDIPLVETDFIFSAISEEFGLIFSVCLLVLCLNCFIRILKLSASYSNRFFQLFTYGAGICYIFQTFLTVGGETKFIPLTGVTLPLVSYGGSSILSTLFMLGMVEMVYILHEERTAGFMERYEQEQQLLAAGSGDGFSGQGDAGFPGSSFSQGGPRGETLPDQTPGFESGPNDSSQWENGGFGPQADGDYASAGSDEMDNFPENGISEEGIFEEYNPLQGGQDSSGKNERTDQFGFYNPDGMNK